MRSLSMAIRVFQRAGHRPWAPLVAVIGLVGCATLAPPAADRRPAHPLDDLSPQEIELAVRSVRGSGRFAEDARFPIIMAREPDKSRLGPGLTSSRQALVIILEARQRQVWEVTVDLAEGRIAEAVAVPGVQPPILLDEYEDLERIVKADPRWQAALARRGITNPDDVVIDGWAAGVLTSAERQSGQRLMRGLPYFRGQGIQNYYARPIEGLVATVDMGAGQVVELLDLETVPLATGDQDLSAPARPRPGLQPLVSHMPQGVSFTVNGQEVAWQNWRFRYSVQTMKGLVLYDVRYRDGDRDRTILHKLSLAEMLVPYGDPRASWSFRNAFDVGEYGTGRTAHSLQPLVDVPSHAVFFDGHFAGDAGEPLTIERAAAVYERDGGLLWKHHDEKNEVMHARRARQLVLTFMSTIGNYDYGINYVFHQDGALEVEVELTGILLVRGSAHAAAPCAPACGELVERHVEAPPHQHFFSFRIDFDVDGRGNTPLELDVRAVPRGPANPEGNAFRLEERVLRSEQAAVRDLDPAAHRTWKVVNPGVRNELGHPVGYALVPGANSVPYLAPDAQIRQRARFIEHHMWFTRYRDGEESAAGSYPNQAGPGQGLPAWVADDEPLEGQDVVGWYTFGVTHFPRPEEWPVMNVTRVGFRLVPVHFFSRNPAMDVPAVPAEAVERELARRRR
jgi:primary-amine oxidase